MPSEAPTLTTAAALAPGRWPRLLGYGGLLPFVGLAIAIGLAHAPIQASASFALLAYGASILSFLGAIHWGLTLREPDGPAVASLAWGVVPSLLAWAAVLIGADRGLYVLAAGLWACWAVDRSAYPRFGLQAWLAMRLRLTLIASVCCLGGALALSVPK